MLDRNERIRRIRAKQRAEAALDDVQRSLIRAADERMRTSTVVEMSRRLGNIPRIARAAARLDPVVAVGA